MQVDMETDQENTIRNENRKSTLQRKHCYRNLLNKIEQIQESEDVGLQTVEALHTILKEANQLDDEYPIEERGTDKVDQTLMDATVLSSASSILVKCIEAVDIGNSVYEPNEFANKIKENIVSDGVTIKKMDWLKLNNEANSILRVVPQFPFVFGTFDPTKLPEPKLKLPQRRGQVEKLQKKCPEKISSVDKEQGMDETVNILLEVLQKEFVRNGSKPINYYTYVVDSDSFVSTVENMFYCSFLISNGSAEMNIDAAGVPVIRPVPKKELLRFKKEGGKNSQMIASVSMDNWEKLRTEEGYLQKYRKQLST